MTHEQRSRGTQAVASPIDLVRTVQLSAAQRAIFDHSELGASAAYNVGVAFRLRGQVNERALRAAVRETVLRRDALRLVVTDLERPAQRTTRFDPDVLRSHDTSSEPDSELVGLRLLRELMTAPFDLRAGPNVRAGLIRLAAEDHLFALVAHHMFCDGWSVPTLISDLATEYRAAVGRPVERSLAPAFLDVAADLVGPDGLRSALADAAYWAGRLGSAVPPVLPSDFVAGKALPWPGDRLRSRISIPINLRAGEAPLARLLASLGVVLRRFAGPGIFPVAIPMVPFAPERVAGTVGLFSNTVPVPLDLTGDPTITELVSRSHRVILDALAHSRMDHSELLARVPRDVRDALSPPRIGLALQPAGRPRLDLVDLLVGPITVGSGISLLDLTWLCWLDGDGCDLEVEFRTDRFSPATVNSMLRVFSAAFARTAVGSGDVPVDTLTLCTAADASQAIGLGRGAPSPESRSLTLAIREIAGQGEGRSALEVGGDRLSYGDLVDRADRLATEIRGHGVGSDDIVALVAQRELGLFIGMLAVRFAGAAYLLIDPDLPDERIAQMLRLSRTKLVLVDPGREDRALGWGDLAAVARLNAQGSSRRGHVTSNGRELAYAVYTSGSTGTPKGVGVEARALDQVAGWYRVHVGVSPTDRVAQVCMHSFDAFALDVWPTWSSGGTLVVAPDAVRRDVRRLRAWLEQERIAIALLITPLYEELARDGPPPRSLRTIVTGGERLRHVRPVGGQRLVNAYGPSEATIIATTADIEESGIPLPPIGRAIGGTDVYVLDPVLQVSGSGVPGELFIGGSSLARGYLDGARDTALRFLPDPFGPPGSRMYRTGDLVRHLPDGQLEFLGRADAQMKVSGFRIDPVEIEQAILAFSGVAQAAVCAVQGVLTAFVTPMGAIDPADVRARLRRTLPRYMIPSRIVIVDDLPRTASGKIDRALLARRELVGAPPRSGIDGYALSESEATHTDVVSATVAAAWRELVGMEPRPDADLFESGANSLIAMRLAARLATDLAVDFFVDDLLAAGTVDAITCALRERIAIARGDDRDGA